MSFRRNQIVERRRSGVSVKAGVREALSAGEKGRVCRVISPGVSYMIAYAGMSRCVRQYHDSIKSAQGAAPSCSGRPGC